jgi:hypothetical protein
MVKKIYEWPLKTIVCNSKSFIIIIFDYHIPPHNAKTTLKKIILESRSYAITFWPTIT